MTDSEYIYRSMRQNDAEQVRQLCYNYWRSETISRALGLEVPRECEKHVEYMLAESLTNKISVVAEERATGNLVGMNMGAIATPDDRKMWTFPKDDPDCKKMIKHEAICDKLHITSDYFTRYKVDKFIFSVGTTVLANHQRKGVGFKLSEKSGEIARLLGVRLVIIECTTDYSRKIVDDLDCQKISHVLLVDPESGIPLRLPGDDQNLYGSLHVQWLSKHSRL